MSEKLIQNVIEIIDCAHQQRYNLTDLLVSLHESTQQIDESCKKSRQKLEEYFNSIKSAIVKALDTRWAQLQCEISKIEQTSLGPLRECEDLIKQSIDNAVKVMEDGKVILENDPANSIERLMKFKDNCDMKSLNSLPEVPNLSDVPFVTVELPTSLENDVIEQIVDVGRVIDRAPVHITEIIERPGGLHIKWSEVDEDVEVSDFCLQFSYGNIKSNDDENATFHTVYTGPATCFSVKNLRTCTPYSFRISCRSDGNSNWSVWSVPKVATTTVDHHKWSPTTPGYSTSNEHKTATCVCETDPVVLYSYTPSYSCGDPISFKILDVGERTPTDGIGISVENIDHESLRRTGAVFVSIEGAVFIDGQEVKMRLPPLGKGSVITFETEHQPNGKIRVSVQVEDKEVTLEWKIAPGNSAFGLGLGLSKYDRLNLFFAMRFCSEYWKIAVE